MTGSSETSMKARVNAYSSSGSHVCTFFFVRVLVSTFFLCARFAFPFPFCVSGCVSGTSGCVSGTTSGSCSGEPKA
ncbi:hypothetical protein Hanom_Chr14g01309151 [Helianthus anomalus]